MAKSKKLTLAAINKANLSLNEQKTIHVLGEYEVRIFTKFRKTLIHNVIAQYFTILQELRGKENVTEETILSSISLLNTLILREFSDIPVPSINNIADLINVSNALLDTGILECVFEHFPKEQLDFLSQELSKASKDIGRIIGEIAVQATFNNGEEDANVQ